MKPVPALVLFVAGLLVGTALTWLALRNDGPVASAPLDGGHVAAEDGTPLGGGVTPRVERHEIVDHDGWRRQGFVEMTPPVRLPSDGAARDKIEVWLRIPEGGVIEARALEDGRRTLRFPEGTIADRVESFGYAKDDAGWKFTVTDVRGTRLARDERGSVEEFHVFVPVGPEPLGRLLGWEWTRGDPREQAAATSSLLAHLEVAPSVQTQGSPEERRAFLTSYRNNNDCAKCHTYDRREQTKNARGIHRATDASGFFVPLAVLMDTVPLEGHRAREMNVGDPYLSFSCPDGRVPALREGDGGARAFRCDDGSPSATLDVARAFAANDPRTLALCRSRAYLREHMDAKGRALFADAFAACSL